jgi:hypothetical protein
MNRKFFTYLWPVVWALGFCLGSAPVLAADEAPDAFVKRISNETLDAVRSDKSIKGGDINKIMQLVDTKLMQHVNFRRMTALATGPGWRKATPEQQERCSFAPILVHSAKSAISPLNSSLCAVLQMTKIWSFKPRSEAEVNLFSLTIALKKRQVKVRGGKFLTSMSWAFGWLKTTAHNFPKKSMRVA